ncbi:molybdopterin synthase sulfur carrier subunit [Chitinophaga sp. CF118]|uniref:MoaD/ThiS family protein n=1 Tax=Chitinophaga sp. CF118 TaxID=1884367 RepID=UPI0008EE2523|nr:MoaD/ThiS family protein [Chitinophaga sp. CF118]SFD25197.1 molybdopterin synthase sulfur carrier subunit [Chitinophaga sp. CF118]
MRVLLFGIAKDIAGAPFIMAEGITTVAELKVWLYKQYPALQKLRSLMIAVNKVYAADVDVLKPEDEIAIIPPVSGG